MTDEANAVAEEVTAHLGKRILIWGASIVASIAIAVGGGLLVEWGRVQRMEERYDAQIAEHSRQISRLDGRVGDIAEVRRELTAIKASLETNTRALERRLERIERGIDAQRE